MIFTISVLVLLKLCIALHELGHAFAMRECGVRVIRVSLLGAPVPGLGTIRLPIKSRFFPETEWVLHPLVVGAYALGSPSDYEKLDRAERLYTSGVGPLTNMIVGGVLFGVAHVFPGVSTLTFGIAEGLRERLSDVWFFTVLAPVLWYWRRFVGTFIILPMGIVGVVYIGMLLLPYLDWRDISIVAGLRELHHVGQTVMTAGAEAGTPILTTVGGVVFVVGVLSATVGGFIHFLPIYPSDGADMLMDMMPERHHNALKRVGYFMSGALVALVVFNTAIDLWTLYAENAPSLLGAFHYPEGY